MSHAEIQSDRKINRSVTFYISSFSMGDALMVGAMAACLKHRGVKCLVIADVGEGVHRARVESECEVHILETDDRRGSPDHRLQAIGHAFRLNRVLRERTPGWLVTSHTTAGTIVGLLAAACSKPTPRRLAFLTGAAGHGAKISGLKSAFYRMAGQVIRRADLLFCDAHYIGNAWARWLGEREAPFFGRVPLAPAAQDPKSGLDGRSTTITVVTIARMGAQKRLDLTIAAIGRVRQLGHPVNLRVCGVDPTDPEFIQMVEAAGLAEHVEALGYVDDVSKELQSADIYVQMSDYEPLGMGVLEALLRGMRVVATDCDGPSELLRDGVGWLVRKGDSGQCAQRLVEALGQPAFDAARQARAEEYSLDHNMPKLMDAMGLE